MRVRAHFKNIDEVIATIKNKDSKKDFHNAGLPSPPDPAITRWATWLRAALYYNEKLPAVYHCEQLDKRSPLSQQSKRHYQCGRFGAGTRLK